MTLVKNVSEHRRLNTAAADQQATRLYQWRSLHKTDVINLAFTARRNICIIEIKQRIIVVFYGLVTKNNRPHDISVANGG